MEVVRRFPDSELVQNIRTGNKFNESIRAIYRDHFDSLSWFVVHNSGSRQDAEDVFKEVVVNFIELVKKEKFSGESTIKTFLYSLNKYIWLNELKRKGRANLHELKYEQAKDKNEMDIGLQLADRESRLQLMNVIEQLGDTCKKILVLFYYNEMSTTEIQHQTDDENEQVVRNKKYKCIKQLEKMLNEKPALKQTLKMLLHG